MCVGIVIHNPCKDDHGGPTAFSWESHEKGEGFFFGSALISVAARGNLIAKF